MDDAPTTLDGPRRPYRQGRRAVAVRATRDRLLQGVVELLLADDLATPSLAALAAAGDTTVPTLLRHFEGRDALLRAGLGDAVAQLRRARADVVGGSPARAAAVLGAEHEAHGRLAVRARLAGATLEPAARAHRTWTARAFAAALGPLPPTVHRRRLAALAAAGEPGAWLALRSDEGLRPRQAEAALADLLAGLLGLGARSAGAP